MATVSAKYLGDLRVECVHNQSGTKIITDAPTDNQGKGEAFSPTDLCATALGACAMTIIGIYGKNHGVDVTGMEMEITEIREVQTVDGFAVARSSVKGISNRDTHIGRANVG